MNGKLYALSTGSGVSDLITVRATHTLGVLDILYVPAERRGGDSLALSIIRGYIGEQTEIRCCHSPMSTDSVKKGAIWDGAAVVLVQETEVDKQVEFITLGDTVLFSTQVSLLQRIGCPGWLEIVPGVTSFAAIAARSKTPLAMEQQSLAVVSCTAPEAEIQQALKRHDSLVLMKVCGRFAHIEVLLQQKGLLDYTLMTSEATLPSEQYWYHLDKVSDDQPLPHSPAILVDEQWEYAQ